MHFTTTVLSLAAAAGLASAANMVDAVNNIPDCSVRCINTGATAAGCQINNFQCMCEASNWDDILKAATTDCGSCGTLDKVKATGSVGQICVTFGHRLRS